MHMQDNTVSVLSVERVLATGFRALRFPPAIEARFEADTGLARSRYLALAGAVALILNAFFLLRDWTIIHDVFTLALIVRLGVVEPLGLTACALVWTNPRPWLRELLAVTSILIAVGAFLYLYASSDSPLAPHAQYALVVVLIFPNIIQRLRFWYALAGPTVALTLCAVVIPHIHAMPSPVAYGVILTMTAATVLSLIANWQFEHNERRLYLLNLRETLIGEDLADANRELSAVSVVDPLTGLGNRRRLDQFVEALWLARRGKHGPIAFLMIDIDFFKSFNDEYGHQAGDECLKAVAAIIQQGLRRSRDLAVRYGGEEFLAVLPDTDLGEAVNIAERIRASIEGRAITRPPRETGSVVTVSIGAAVVWPDDSPSSMPGIAAADAAMYVAKEHGRNCVWPRPGAAADPKLPFS